MARQVALAASAIEKLRCDGVVAVRKNVCFHRDGFANDALDGKFPAINLRLHALNDDAASTFQLGCNCVFCLLLAFRWHQKISPSKKSCLT